MRSSLAWLAALALMSGALPALAQPVTATPPEEIAAVKGVVTVTLDARAEPIDFGPVTIDGILYNHHFAGPTLRAKPGDLLKITLVNHLNEVTNLHFHGMETSPRGHSDNVHVMLQPGKSQLYEVRIPKTQPPGVYWYHAHIHGVTERQVMHGLAGAIMI